MLFKNPIGILEKAHGWKERSSQEISSPHLLSVPQVHVVPLSRKSFNHTIKNCIYQFHIFNINIDFVILWQHKICATIVVYLHVVPSLGAPHSQPLLLPLLSVTHPRPPCHLTVNISQRKKGQFRNPSITTPPCAPGWIGQCPRTSTGLAPNAPYQPSSMSFHFEFNLFNNLHSEQELVSHWSHLNSDLKATWGHPAKRPMDASGRLSHLLYSDHIIWYDKKSSSTNQ